MHSNFFYRALLCAFFLIALWYSGTALYRYTAYAQLKNYTSIATSEWHVHEAAEDEFYVEAAYTFSINQKIFFGTASWPHKMYRNHWAAEQDLPTFKEQHKIVWYNPSNPNHSSLQKSFPLKECISAVLIWGILFYFLGIGFYIDKFKT